MAVSKNTQDLIDQAVTEAVKQAQAGLTVAQSKPHLVEDLRKTWRKSAEHKAAQIKRFIYSMAAVVGANVIGDVTAHKDPLAHFTDIRTAWYYLIPFAYIAWKQAHPSMSASEVDSAPGVTIVPSQVGAQTVDVPVDTPPATTDVATDVEGDAAP